MSTFAIGEWNHLFGVGSQETRCRIVIDVEKSALIAAQEWTGMRFEDLCPDQLRDLAESVIDVNMAYSNSDAWGLELGNELPGWAEQRRMMRIEQRPQGWTVVNDAGELRLHTADGSPLYLPTKDEVVRQCNANGMYQAAKDNPAGYPEGTLLEATWGRSESQAMESDASVSIYESPRG